MHKDRAVVRQAALPRTCIRVACGAACVMATTASLAQSVVEQQSTGTTTVSPLSSSNPPSPAAQAPDVPKSQDASQQPAEPSTDLAVPGDLRPPTGIGDELERIRPGVALKRKFDELAKEANLRLGIANTLLFQQASAGPGDRSAGGGDIDILAKWTVIGAGTKDTGVLGFAAEYRYQIGDQTPSALGGQIGSLTPTTNSFSERPMVVKEAYWDQRLFEDRFRFGFGRIDPENLFGGHRLQSANLYFFNKVFSSNPTVSYPGPGAAVAAQIKPVPWLYLTGGISDANGSATIGNLEGFIEDDEYLKFVEFGATPEHEKHGSGRYRLAFWHIDSRDAAGRPSDEGFSISADQELNKKYTLFARYGHAEGDVTKITNSVQGGLAIKGLLAEEDLFGVALAWSEPADSDLRDEKVFEVFHRFQVTETSQATFGVELIFDPSNAPEDDLVGVFSFRLRVAF